MSHSIGFLKRKISFPFHFNMSCRLNYFISFEIFLKKLIALEAKHCFLSVLSGVVIQVSFAVKFFEQTSTTHHKMVRKTNGFRSTHQLFLLGAGVSGET